jgi:glyoxylase-like metal-dependent hydrolase (beta-lactamase superfamily II)
MHGSPTRNATPAVLDRRRLLLGGGALGAAVWLAPAAGAATAPFRRKVGAIDLTIISDGVLDVPLSFALPETPASEAAALFAAHNLPPAGPPPQTNVSLIKTGNELVLIDAGSGANFQPTAGKLAENMEAAGIDPGTVTKVVFTHGHADHLWGALDDFDDGERFPKASYVIAAPEWDFWTDPNTADKAPDWLKGMARGSARILKRLEGKIERRRPGEAVAPGLTCIDTAGHTPGHMAVLVDSGRESAMIVGDVLGNAAVSFARPEWRLGSDYDRDRGVVTRRRMLDQLATDRISMVGFHIAWPGYGRVERSGAAYRFVRA